MEIASPHQITYIVALRAELGLRPLDWNEITTLTKRFANVMIKDLVQIKKTYKQEERNHVKTN